MAKVATLVPARFTPTVVAAISWSRTAIIDRPTRPRTRFQASRNSTTMMARLRK